jgi:peptidoglycan/xylan/chitin deacetylase (PgdA/CDA1 family)
MKSLMKKLARFTGYSLGLWRFGYRIHALTGRKPILVVFTFHRVTDSERSSKHYMYYEKGVGHRVFERQLEAISRYFQVVGLEDFIDLVTGRTQPEGHTALITFDDADSEFIEYALPVLRRFGFPSVMFAPTDFIETDRRFWHLRVSNLLHQLTPAHWDVMRRVADRLPPTIAEVLCGDFPADENARASLALALNHRLNEENIKDVLKIIESWEAIVGSTFVMDIKCMNWNQLRDLDSDSVYVESHSASHGKLANLEPGEIERELLSSKEVLERRLRKTVKAISYPAGSYNEDVLRAAQRTGYKIGFTTEAGLCNYPLTGLDLFRLPRFSLYGDTRNEIHYVLGLLPFKALYGRKP